MASDTEFHTSVLPNGIRCVLRRISSPVAYCALTIGAGSRDESHAMEGAAHFAEHMLFKGTARRRPHHIISRLEKLGGELNAFTTKEETVVHATTLRADLGKAADLISDMVFESAFPQKELDRERNVILDEINSYKDSPADRIYDEFEDMIFAGSPLGHNILGTRRSVTAMNRERLADFTRQHYSTDNMVLAVAADMTHKEMEKIAGRWFADRICSHRTTYRTVPVNNICESLSLNRRTHQTHCITGSRTFGLHDPRRVAMAVLINYLGGPASNSRLNIMLREKNGLTYGVEASYTAYSDCGLAAVYFGTEKQNTDKCLSLVEAELRKLRNERFTTLQLAAAKKQFAGQLAIGMESTESNLLAAAKSILAYGQLDSREKIYRKIDSITASELLEVADQTFADPCTMIYT